MNILVLSTLAFALSGHTGAKSFSFNGEYEEGCSCMGVCQCEMTGVEMGCQGVGLFRANSATFDGQELGSFKAAYAVVPGSWAIIYVDAQSDKVAGVTDFMKAALAAFGPVEAVRNAQIDYEGVGHESKVVVDGKPIISFSCEAITGGDGKSPMAYSNIHDVLHPTVMQGKTDACAFKDGSHSFDLKGTNAFFNDHIDSSGSF